MISASAGRCQPKSDFLSVDIESVGKNVRSFGKGDKVFAATGIGLGAYAEYICLRENPQTGAIAYMSSRWGCSPQPRLHRDMRQHRPWVHGRMVPRLATGDTCVVGCRRRWPC